jgi:hypothetical protein
VAAVATLGVAVIAKQLWFTNVAASTHRGDNTAKLAGATSWWQPLALSESRGASATTATVASIAGTTVGIEFVSGAVALEWLSEPLSADFTISGTITGNLWGFESTMNDNTAINFVVDKIDGATRAITQIAKSARVTELGLTPATVNNFTVTPTSTACKRGDRIRVRPFIDDAGAAMIVGTTTFSYNGPTSSAAGDSYVQFTENLTFETAAPTGSTYYLTSTAETINPGSATEKKALTARGSSFVSQGHAGGAAGPTAPIQLGTVPIEWYTPPLEAVTFGGKAALRLWANETLSSTNASLGAEIAVVAGDGTGATVWGYANIESNALGGEIANTEAQYTAWVAGDDVAITAGQRLRFRVFVDDSAIGPYDGGSLTLHYNGPTVAARGDTYVILPVAVTEQVAAATKKPRIVSSPVPVMRAAAR